MTTTKYWTQTVYVRLFIYLFIYLFIKRSLHYFISMCIFSYGQLREYSLSTAR
jgi:hypothetical protein